MRTINSQCIDQKLVSKESYYRAAMPVVGFYNQLQHNGTGYNPGFPFYGEHTYSGTAIYKGYFGVNPPKK